MDKYIAVKDNSVKHTAYYIIQPSNLSKDYFDGSKAYKEMKEYILKNGGGSLEVRRGSKIKKEEIK